LLGNRSGTDQETTILPGLLVTVSLSGERHSFWGLNSDEIMRKKQAARQHFTAAFALAALVLAFAVNDARVTETLVDADPDSLVLNPEGE
jgi:hypothetical protein